MLGVIKGAPGNFIGDPVVFHGSQCVSWAFFGVPPAFQWIFRDFIGVPSYFFGYRRHIRGFLERYRSAPGSLRVLWAIHRALGGFSAVPGGFRGLQQLSSGVTACLSGFKRCSTGFGSFRCVSGVLMGLRSTERVLEMFQESSRESQKACWVFMRGY